MKAVHYDEDVVIARALISHLQTNIGWASCSPDYLGNEGDSPSSSSTNLDVPERESAAAGGSAVVGSVAGTRDSAVDQKPGEFLRKKDTEEVLVPAKWTVVRRKSKREKKRSTVSSFSCYSLMACIVKDSTVRCKGIESSCLSGKGERDRGHTLGTASHCLHVILHNIFLCELPEVQRGKRGKSALVGEEIPGILTLNYCLYYTLLMLFNIFSNLFSSSACRFLNVSTSTQPSSISSVVLAFSLLPHTWRFPVSSQGFKRSW